jgi:pyrroloquinoline quinone biosynthesis protein B
VALEADLVEEVSLVVALAEVGKKMKNYTILFLTVLSLFSCKEKELKQLDKQITEPYLYVLGIAQDAGYPQAGCEKECCQRVYENPENERYTVSLALVDPISNENWVFDATPNFKEQLKMLSDQLKKPGNLPNGIFLTHAHMGHYTGLMHLGREVMGAKEVSVFAMPKMKLYLENNGPWSQLVDLNNISLKEIKHDSAQILNERISVTPLLVPHRDEYSETVGFLINVNSKKVLFIPDIDKWSKWDKDIISYIKQVDIALLDATFFKDGEIKGRAMSEIPHPFVEESIDLFKDLSESDKGKVHFIHFNHTNPLLIDGSAAQKTVLNNGFKIAKQGVLLRFSE